jgi:hypothetical protein
MLPPPSPPGVSSPLMLLPLGWGRSGVTPHLGHPRSSFCKSYGDQRGQAEDLRWEKGGRVDALVLVTRAPRAGASGSPVLSALSADSGGPGGEYAPTALLPVVTAAELSPIFLVYCLVAGAGACLGPLTSDGFHATDGGTQPSWASHLA